MCRVKCNARSQSRYRSNEGTDDGKSATSQFYFTLLVFHMWGAKVRGTKYIAILVDRKMGVLR